MKCPCGSNLEYMACCQPVIAGNKKAETAEQLMRSRYSAYATKQADYIYDTYASASQRNITKSEIAAWANETHWCKLQIVNSEDHPDYATVEFIAHYQNGRQSFYMHERSRFIVEQGLWRYLDGEIIEHAAN